MGKVHIEDRVITLAHYIINSKDTVRATAKKFGVSKSTVHAEVTLKNGKKTFKNTRCRDRRPRRPRWNTTTN